MVNQPCRKLLYGHIAKGQLCGFSAQDPGVWDSLGWTGRLPVILPGRFRDKSGPGWLYIYRWV